MLNAIGLNCRRHWQNVLGLLPFYFILHISKDKHHAVTDGSRFRDPPPSTEKDFVPEKGELKNVGVT